MFYEDFYPGSADYPTTNAPSITDTGDPATSPDSWLAHLDIRGELPMVVDITGGGWRVIA